MPAGGVGKKIIVGFLKAPLAEVMQIVGFAFTDRYYGEPAAAFAATAAGTGDWGVMLRFHTSIMLDRYTRKDNGLKDTFRILTEPGEPDWNSIVPENIRIAGSRGYRASERADILQQVSGIQTEHRVLILIQGELPESPESPGTPD